MSHADPSGGAVSGVSHNTPTRPTMTKPTKPTYEIPYWLRLGIPRSCQGQMVEESYGIDSELGVVVCRTHDRSDGTVTWALCDLDDSELGALEGYDANGAADPPECDGDWREVSVVREDDA